MRYLKLENVEEGMRLGKSMYDSKGTVLLHRGTILKESYIRAIRDFKYSGLYIEDEFSEDIEIEDVIPVEVRTEAFQKVKLLFENVQKNPSHIDSMRQKQMNDVVEKIIDSILRNKGSIINLMDLKKYDDYTFSHSVNVSVISLVIGTELGLNRAALFNLGIAAMFHDIGKMFIDKAILNKPDKLTPSEFDIMKTHSEKGYLFIKDKFNFSATAFIAVWQHHEKYNGTGYPLGKEGRAIIENARVISIADVYDAITSKRPYSQPMAPSEAFEYIVANSGSMFDPAYVDVFKRRVATFPLGVTVELSNGARGIVVKNHESFMNRPIVKLFAEHVKNGKEYLDLLSDKEARSVTVLKML